MKFFLVALSILFVFASCDNDSEKAESFSKDTYFKVSEFKSLDGSVDLNNDGITNTDIQQEITNYSNMPYDLQVKLKDNLTLLSFYLPNQNISYDYSCCPDGYNEFSRGVFAYALNKSETSIENIEIDDENKIILFSKIDDLNFKFIIEKKYYDFNISSYTTKRYEINYLKTD